MTNMNEYERKFYEIESTKNNWSLRELQRRRECAGQLFLVLVLESHAELPPVLNNVDRLRPRVSFPPAQVGPRVQASFEVQILRYRTPGRRTVTTGSSVVSIRWKNS